MKKTKRSFTLLELLLAMSLLAMIGGLMAFKAKELIDAYGFRYEVAQVLGKLELARALSLGYGADIKVVFQEEKKGGVCRVFSEEPALKKQTLLFQPISCKNIRSLTIKGSHEVLFSGSGWVFPLGDIEITSLRGKETLRKSIAVALKEKAG